MKPQTGVGQGLKENAPKGSAIRQGLLLYTGEKNMDLLQRCAVVFERLTGYQYRFTLGRKGKRKEIILGLKEDEKNKKGAGSYAD